MSQQRRREQQQQQEGIASYMRTQKPDAASLRYTAFINQIAGSDSPRHFRKFAALRNFLHLDGFAQHGIPPCVGKPIITIATLKPNKIDFVFQNVETHELGLIIDPDVLQLFLVENITPELVKVLGRYLEIDPQFFLDYIDAIPKEFNITKGEEDVARPELVPTPCYRLQSLEGHLPMLRSSTAECEHIRMRFVGPRQCSNRRHAKERMRPDLQKLNVERVAGLQIPIARDTGVGGRQFDNVAMTRQCASVWFKTPADPKKPEWLKGLVLLDPPFEIHHTIQKEYGEILPSMHQTCLTYLAPFNLNQQDRDLLDDRSSYREFLVRYLQTLSLNTRSDFHPLLLVRGVGRIVTNAHVERDTNTIEWQLETMSAAAAAADVAVLQKVLSRLFTHRRRIARYQVLVEEQGLLSEQGGSSASNANMPAITGRRLDTQGPADDLCCAVKRQEAIMARAGANLWVQVLTNLAGAPGNQSEYVRVGPVTPAAVTPAAWLPRRLLPRAARQALRDIQTEANQAHDLVTRNAERVAQLVELLISVMSVREAGLSVRQNETLTFLALVATFALPFNAVAAVLAVQTRFGPEGELFWVFWVASLCTWALV
ncbi:hypothetical protein N658DRAFT_561457 [Parathielavia hyrcaniae]|uniref:Uncharacterized protein n=1 Tax=Parathielavia hyrcaniae TaxID=113614 RepID=A0AAN6SYN5_9PEZI|nr:hypothetical protein N658DRAFT_561457 [Parathielavia hyrcaniae]